MGRCVVRGVQTPSVSDGYNSYLMIIHFLGVPLHTHRWQLGIWRYHSSYSGTPPTQLKMLPYQHVEVETQRFAFSRLSSSKNEAPCWSLNTNKGDSITRQRFNYRRWDVSDCRTLESVQKSIGIEEYRRGGATLLSAEAPELLTNVYIVRKEILSFDSETLCLSYPQRCWTMLPLSPSPWQQMESKPSSYHPAKSCI